MKTNYFLFFMGCTFLFIFESKGQSQPTNRVDKVLEKKFSYQSAVQQKIKINTQPDSEIPVHTFSFMELPLDHMQCAVNVFPCTPIPVSTNKGNAVLMPNVFK